MRQLGKFFLKKGISSLYRRRNNLVEWQANATGWPADGFPQRRRIGSDSTSARSRGRTNDRGGRKRHETATGGRASLKLSLLASLPAVSGCAGGHAEVELVLAGVVRFGRDGGRRASRTAWWRGSAAGSSTESTPSVTATGIEPLPAGVVGSPDVWPESQSEWLGAPFPVAQPGLESKRLWRPCREGVDPSVRTQTSQVSTRSATTRNPSSSRADEDIRPVQASSDDDTASNGATAGLGQRQRRNGACRLGGTAGRRGPPA